MKTRMMNIALIFTALTLAIADGAFARWVNISAALPETDIRCVVCDPADPKLIYAASERRLYKTQNSGVSWEQVFTAWGVDNKVWSVYPDPVKRGTVYAACNRGAWKSNDFGRHWQIFFQGIDSQRSGVYCVTLDAENPDKVWLGTQGGLVIVSSGSQGGKSEGNSKESAGFGKDARFPNVAVYSILMNTTKNAPIVVLAADGIYQSFDGGEHWQRSQAYSPKDGSADDNTDEAADSGNSYLTNFPGSLIYQPSLKKYVAATPKGVYVSAADQSPKNPLSWNLLESSNADGSSVHYLSDSAATFYKATDRGVFQWDSQALIFRDISEGLVSLEIRMIDYEPCSDSLLAATKKGIFRYIGPAAEPGHGAPGNQAESLRSKGCLVDPAEVLKKFENEPTIGEIQKAAIDYAEVHPRKIQEWRDRAAKKAWLPSLSMSQKISRNQTIDLDRGGTADPDKFIYGPEERNGDWSVGACWDLGEIIWNNDQTSIDTRSRLTVELRDDVLNEVTHLYYERRRVQVDRLLNPTPDVAAEVEKQLHLDELTAGIDALTGGYLSARLEKTSTARTSRCHPREGGDQH